jgi:hypothetical protein
MKPGDFYLGMMARFDDLEEMVTVCMLAIRFIHEEKLTKKFMEHCETHFEEEK